MAKTPQAAVGAHMAALNSKDAAQVAASVAFPFLHIDDTGRKFFYASADDLPDPTQMPFERSEIVEARILTTSGDLLVYELTFHRHDQAGPTIRVRGLWGVHRTSDGWAVGWRQYLGEV